MPETAHDSANHFRRSVYGLLIALALGSVAGRILAVDSVDRVGLEKHLKQQGRKDWQKTRPFLSANDRSRWATVRALVEHGTYEIDQVIFQPNWDSIDIVMHEGRDGRPHLYSSKPPLLATLLAGPYWLIYNITGASLGTHPYAIGRALLLAINLPLLAVYLTLLARLVERLGTSHWGRVFVVAAGALGTFLTTFAVVLNNHLIAAAAVVAAVYCAVEIVYFQRRELRWFVGCGLCAALAAANELPALSLFALLGAGLAWKAPKAALVAFLPAALLVAAASVGTNYLAHNTWRPPYSFKNVTDKDQSWYHFTFDRPDGKKLVSYWNSPKGIDQGEPSRGRYAVHVLVGHHGILSLTPIWLLSAGGAVLMWRLDRWRELAALTIALSVVCLAFYILGRPQDERNYGGMTSAFRWTFWLIPLWLVAMTPLADTLSLSRPRRVFALLLLAMSVLSASYPTWNPFTHPWLMNFMLDRGWVTLPQ